MFREGSEAMARLIKTTTVSMNRRSAFMMPSGGRLRIK